jgi:hypothetical protein
MSSVWSSRLAVLIIGYGRTENISKLIDVCAKSNIEKIYLYLDMAKNGEIGERQNEVISQIQAHIPRVKVKRSIKNQGVAISVIQAIDWFFEHEEFGAILEDDLEITMDTLKYFQSTREIIDGDERILMASASNFGFHLNAQSNEKPTGLFCNIPLIWGWSTTKIKWTKLRGYIVAKSHLSLRILMSSSASYFFIASIGAMSREVDTWDSPIAFNMLMNGDICLVSPFNLVTNIGSDEYAVHTKEKKFPLGIPIQYETKSNARSNSFIFSEAQNINGYLLNEVFGVSFRHNLSAIRIILTKRFRNRNKLQDSLQSVEHNA